MLYEELLMDTSTLLKFKLFKKLYFLDSPSYSIAVLANEMALNYQQTVIDLTEIDHEISELDPTHETILVGAGKVNCQNISCTLDEYRYYLLKKSIPFQYVLYFLNEEQPTIDDFCEKHFSSRSTVSRKIERLKQHLKKFQLRFTYTEAGMVGDERLVRIALFNIIWLGVRGVEWPFAVSEELADKLVENFAHYFPLSQTYLGNWELKYFAGISLSRIKKDQLAKYDKAYDFLMKDNPYYVFDPDLVNFALPVPLNKRQIKGEISFIHFAAHFVPFYTWEDDSNLRQTIHDFATRENPVYPLVQDFLSLAKEKFFPENPDVLDHPMILGNLLNITFGYYVIQHPFPTIPNLVTVEQPIGHQVKELEEEICAFFLKAGENPVYRKFINRQTQPLITLAFRDVLLPFYDQNKHAKKVIVGVALEHNYLLVRQLYQVLADIKFVEAAPFSEQKRAEYDLVISSSLLLKRKYPDLPIFIWDHSADESQYMSAYQMIRTIFNQKNQ